MSMSCDHSLDGEYLTTSDAAVVDLYGEGDAFRVDLVVSCQDCGQALRLTLEEEAREETDVDFPLDDAEAAGG
jgi:hypothetical protein